MLVIWMDVTVEPSVAKPTEARLQRLESGPLRCTWEVSVTVAGCLTSRSV